MTVVLMLGRVDAFVYMRLGLEPDSAWSKKTKFASNVTPSFPQRAEHINTFTGMRKGLRSLLLSVLCFSQDSSDAAASFGAATQQVHWLCQHLIPPL